MREPLFLQHRLARPSMGTSARLPVSGPWRRKSFAFSFVLGILLLLQSFPAAGQRPSEYQVKAAFLYNFPNFIEWPAETVPDTATTLTIGILGDDPFGKAFEPFAEKTIKGRQVAVRRSNRLQELPVCQILFICDSEKKYLPQILEHLQGRSVLTVGETEGFGQAGVIVNFILQDNKVRFEVNLAAAEGAGLKFSAKLLKLALIVQEEQE